MNDKSMDGRLYGKALNHGLFKPKKMPNRLFWFAGRQTWT